MPGSSSLLLSCCCCCCCCSRCSMPLVLLLFSLSFSLSLLLLVLGSGSEQLFSISRIISPTLSIGVGCWFCCSELLLAGFSAMSFKSG
ncbi:hypothetical protein BDA99DRAFT_529843 [Phascolomyces articulosus]|uniref:Secreted peptide n=1 Tax=Phascolomyces articulosus TaxID=60185 RepID=A0AAD5JVI0_9FUNG|nr:hypothetical protein BDA99DRAFT_529843 [Phascolomyces articulosus]